MGGMQTLCFAIEHPHFAKKHIMLASTYATQPWAIAFNKVAREAIIKDPAFKEGQYDVKEIQERGFSGLSVGRMAGHISYLSPTSMEHKFGRIYDEKDGLYDLFGKYQVEKYLDYNSRNFVTWFDPLSYLYITKAINIFDAMRNYDSLDDSLSRIISKLTLISFKADMLFLPQEMKYIEETMKKIGKADLTQYIEIDSDYGHDAFLVEIPKFEQIIIDALEQ